MVYRVNLYLRLTSSPVGKAFGEDMPHPAHHCTRRPTFNREQLLKLPAAEHSDEVPDDGELSGSGDDYED
jgi:hypothetical protein